MANFLHILYTIGAIYKCKLKKEWTPEDYNVEKIHKVIEWAIRPKNVSLSEIEMNAHLSIRDKIETEEIHKILTKSANDLVSTSHPNYQYVASRLLNMSLRKELWEHYDSLIASRITYIIM